MKKISKGKVLIIPDMHQCIGWVNKILDQEKDFDHIVFLGDYFDCIEKPDGVAYHGIKQTCLWLNKQFKELGNKATWLVGNHDVSYLAVYRKNSFKAPRHHLSSCSGYSRSKAIEINKNLHPDFFQNLDLAVQVGDYILSHAGFHPDFLNQETNARGVEAVKEWCEMWKNDLRNGRITDQSFHWICEASPYRGGISTPSPVWCDWDYDFFPIIDLPQIVGHTNNVPSNKIREKTSNFCIDDHRTTYAIWKDGELEFKKEESTYKQLDTKQLQALMDFFEKPVDN